MRFYKYQGNGNDFVIIDNQDKKINHTPEIRAQLCNRKFGIGADGFIEIVSCSDNHFTMNYYNSDGNMSTLCGNGSRCAVAFVHNVLGKIEPKASFESNGIHNQCLIIAPNLVSIQMSHIELIHHDDSYSEINTGSPHYVKFDQNIEDSAFVTQARAIRYSPSYPDGINVNWVKIINKDTIYVRTYERGVEDETLSCGTGVTASVLAYALKSNHYHSPIKVITKGGDFNVEYDYQNQRFENVWLTGPATMVYHGTINLN